VGGYALDANTTANANIGIGYSALGANTTGTLNVAMGHETLDANTTGDHNTAVGTYALGANTTAEGNTAMGYGALTANTTANYNTAFGYNALDANTTGTTNVAVGSNASGAVTTGSQNVSVGLNAGGSITTGGNNMQLGYDSGNSGSPGGAITTGNNEITIGNASHSKINTQVSLTVASDERDKTDFTDLDLGLAFVNQLAPVTYKWDKRTNYVNWDANPDTDLNTITPDGTHKESWLDVGFKAQAVNTLEEAAGYTLASEKNLTVSLAGDGKQYGIKYEKFVPILVKALQEADDKIDALTARVAALES